MRSSSMFALIVNDICSLSFLRDVFREFLGTALFLFCSLSTVVLYECSGPPPLETRTVDPLRAVESPHQHRHQHPDPLHVSFAFGVSVFVTCICLGGVHLNPAVTLVQAAALRISPWKGVVYVGAQLLGAVVACGVLMGTASEPLGKQLGINELAPGVRLYQALSVEAAVTFQLVLTVLALARPKTATGPLNAAVLGLSIMLGHLVAIGITGCGMNPARSFGPAVLTMNFENHWAFWAGPALGAMMAWILHDLVLWPRWRYIRDWLTEFRESFLKDSKKQPRSPESNMEI